MTWILVILACIIVVFLAEYYVYKSGNEDKKSIKKPFYKSEACIGILIQVLVTALGAGLGIAFTTYQEKEETKTQIVALLDLARQEAQTSYDYNVGILKNYQESSYDLGDLKVMSTAECNMVELILENDDALLTMTPTTISNLISTINDIEVKYNYMVTLDDSDQNILYYLSLLEEDLYMVTKSLEIEIDYLNKDCSKEEATKRYNELLQDTINSDTTYYVITK